MIDDRATCSRAGHNLSSASRYPTILLRETAGRSKCLLTRRTSWRKMMSAVRMLRGFRIRQNI